MTKVKMFSAYSILNGNKRSVDQVEQEINEFIKDKKLIDIKAAGSQDDYGFEMFHYVVIYEEEN